MTQWYVPESGDAQIHTGGRVQDDFIILGDRMDRHIHAIEVFGGGLAFEACPFTKVTVRWSGWFHFMRSRLYGGFTASRGSTSVIGSVQGKRPNATLGEPACNLRLRA